MLHKMSEVRGWGHDEMMSMSKTLFFRYYGYWYAEQINEERYRIWMDHKSKLEAKSAQNRKTLNNNYE